MPHSVFFKLNHVSERIYFYLSIHQYNDLIESNGCFTVNHSKIYFYKIFMQNFCTKGRRPCQAYALMLMCAGLLSP